MKTLFWRSLVVVFVILGFIGALLPGMPTTVFLILAAWAASKGWPQMDAWLLNHPKYGPTLRAWRENGTVPRKAKWFASIMMFVSGLIMLFTSAPITVKIFTDLTMLIVGIWLWTRPEPNKIRTIETSQQTQPVDKDKQKEQEHV
ncbi:YbaN family protein [Acinetobacter sp. YH12140]|uniref:YbaN family protein n=1 Tax=Acinetobacter sp. YH12140 TaxID=2601124 RepID=UPI0015D311B9|nr:YbaN family protein [Acinetobacter sp. YH12140]